LAFQEGFLSQESGSIYYLTPILTPRLEVQVTEQTRAEFQPKVSFSDKTTTERVQIAYQVKMAFCFLYAFFQIENLKISFHVSFGETTCPLVTHQSLCQLAQAYFQKPKASVLQM
jgi:hypothetical protein